MSIASALENAQQKVANAYTVVDNKGGTLPQTQNLANLPTAINSIVTGGDVTSLSITPSTSSQSFSKQGQYDGYNPVTVSAVTSAIDPNIQPKFIRNGIEILGVEGTYGDEYVPSMVACSGATTWYKKENGDLYGCGNGESGQQGNSSTSNVTSFTKRASNVKEVVCFPSVTWYITNDGDLYGCGYNSYGQQGSGNTTDVTSFTKRASNVNKFCSKSSTSWYITNDGYLYGCGKNDYGQQGNSSYGTNVKTFTQRASNVKDVYPTSSDTCYINNSGDLYICGENFNGQHGSGTATKVTTFTKRASNVKQVIIDSSNTFYISTSNVLYGCGIYVGQRTFTQIAEGVRKIISAGLSVWYITVDDDLYGYGYNNSGQQGSGNTTNVSTFTKRASNVKDVVGSNPSSDTYGGMTCYLTNDDKLYICGANNTGQQGSNGRTNVTTFTQRATNVRDVRCDITSLGSGYFGTTWYIDNNNVLYGCGSNAYKQQGNNSSSDVLTFTQRANLET